jgi:hypothetical protein
VRPGPIRFERGAAAAFIVAAAPLAFAVVASGGIAALAPLVLIVVPMLVLGIAPGFAALDEACRRMSQPAPASRPDNFVMRPAHADPWPVSQVVRSLADRGPPGPLRLIAQ